MLLATWIAWTSWVLWHYFVLPADPFLLLDGVPLAVPYWREATQRAALALAGATVVTAAAWNAGWWLLRVCRVPLEDRLDRTLFSLAAGFAALSFTYLALAMAGLYRPAIVIALTLSTALVGAGRLIAAGRVTRWAPRLSAAAFGAEDRVFIVVVLVAILMALVAALAPETEYDALWYHLWVPRQWLAAGRPVDLVHEYPSLSPQTWELLFGAGMSMGGPVAARLLHFICLPLIGVTAARLATVVMPDGRGAAAAAALAVVSPTIIWEATTAYVDLALAWYMLLGVYAVVRYAGAARAHWLGLAAACIGVGMAIKHLGLVAFAIVTVAVTAIAWRRVSAGRALRAAVLFAAIALLLPSPYYLRAYAASGNPVFPDLYGLFGASPAERWDDLTERELTRFKSRFGRERTLGNLLLLPWDATIHGARYGGSAGPLFLLLVPLGLLAGSRVRWILAGCGAFLIVWASPLSSFQFRFIVPSLPILAVVAAGGLRRLPRGAAYVVVPLLVMNLPPFIEWHERDRQGWTGWLTHVVRALPVRVVVGAESARAYLSRTVPSYSAWQHANARLPLDARVLTFFGGDHLYSARDRLSSDTPAARPATWDQQAGGEQASHAALRRLGVTHVLIDRRQADGGAAASLAIMSEAMRRCCLEEVYSDGRSALYRVR